MTDEGKKIISDEDWKEQAQREKEKLSEALDQASGPQAGEHPPLPEPTFSVFIAGLATEAYMALGELENPITKEKACDLAHAKYIIDMMEMIKEKTAGNLAPEENEGIEALLYDCRMRFVNASKAPAKE